MVFIRMECSICIIGWVDGLPLYDHACYLVLSLSEITFNKIPYVNSLLNHTLYYHNPRKESRKFFNLSSSFCAVSITDSHGTVANGSVKCLFLCFIVRRNKMIPIWISMSTSTDCIISILWCHLIYNGNNAQNLYILA